jgi:hypothetical protein
MSSSSSSTSTDTKYTKSDPKTRENSQHSENESKFSIQDSKSSKFKELTQLLQQWGFNVTDKTKVVNIAGIEHQAEVIPPVPYPSGLSTPFYLEFQDDLDDGFILRTTFELDKNIEIHLNNQNRAREIELTYIEINELILPLRVSIIRDHPFLKLYKVMFYPELKKQEFLDAINDLINSMTIISGKWDEKYYQLKTTDKKEKAEKAEKAERKINDLELEKILRK